MNKIVLILSFFCLGCSIKTIDEIDATNNWQDSGPSFFSEGQNHECIEGMIQTDFFNCGACDAACNPTNSDHCEEGFCMCGEGPSCIEGADCRRGRCVFPNLEEATCEFDDECNANSACIEGYCTFIECVPEVCDGIDNNCDGVVDGTVAGPLAEWCYSGPETSPLDINSPCMSGVRVCSGGEWSECIGEVPPYEEVGQLACNGIDDNCDLCVDGNFINGMCQPINPEGFDIVFVLDQSGSMSSFIDAMFDAIRDFSNYFNRPDFRWAIVLAPGEMDRSIEVYTDFVNYPVFVQELNIVSGRTFVGGSEPSWDAIYDVGSNSLGLSFLPNRIRVIILFTDEGGQTFATPGISEYAACNQLTHGEVFVVFERAHNFEDYDECATDMFELSPDPILMADNLRNIIEDPCLEN